jgi:hypothetical protein
MNKADPDLLEAHEALNQAIRKLEEITGAKIASVEVMEDGSTLIMADFDSPEAVDFFAVKAGFTKRN